MTIYFLLHPRVYIFHVPLTPSPPLLDRFTFSYCSNKLDRTLRYGRWYFSNFRSQEGRSGFRIVLGFIGVFFFAATFKKWGSVPCHCVLRCQEVGYYHAVSRPHTARARAKLSQGVQKDCKPEQIQLSHFKTTRENIYTEWNVWFPHSDQSSSSWRWRSTEGFHHREKY